MIEKIGQRLRISLRQVETFIAVARSGSTYLAAQNLARSQSAISAALAELEDLLGTPLFDRVGRRLRLNEHGSKLLPMANGLVERATELEAAFDAAALPPLRIGASYTAGEYLLPPLISRWQRQHAQAQVRLVIANTEAVLDAVSAMDIDIGFVEGANTRPVLHAEHWLHDELIVFAAPSHPLVGRPVSDADLAHALWFLREPGSGTREVTDRLLAPWLDRPHAEVVVGSNEALKNAVATGAGLGCLSVHAVKEAFARAWLAPIQVKLPPIQRTLSIVIHRNKPLSELARLFVQYCRSMPRDQQAARAPDGAG